MEVRYYVLFVLVVYVSCLWHGMVRLYNCIRHECGVVHCNALSVYLFEDLLSEHSDSVKSIRIPDAQAVRLGNVESF